MTGSAAGLPLELWGGVECSVVRVGDEWRDQVIETGHQDHGVANIAAATSLGLRTLRYPLVWERLGSGDPGAWAWQQRQLTALRDHGVTVIAGLVHHGSGPAGTSLLDLAWGEKLAAYAGDAARRCPGIHAWTPVNEPLTTARFSCLYGYWYPHARDEGAFLRALANQCRGILLAMRAIRGEQPDACFVHTEDIGRVFSTPPLASQARYENGRRWLSLDLLCGKVGPRHPWRRILEHHGVAAADLDALATGEAAPDLIGVNYYATSDRYLDHRLRLYPPHLRGGNGQMEYADTEALRVDLGNGLTGWEPRLREVWQRYRRPMAVTEAHLGCDDPYEPVRWLMEAWQAARTLRADGADIRAVTAWALFGLMDWNSMLREHQGHFEPGALDARAAPPRLTPLAAAISGLARHGSHWHPSLDEPGWWRRDERVHASLRIPA